VPTTGLTRMRAIEAAHLSAFALEIFIRVVMGNITIIQGITLSIAVLGAVLGIINTWQALDRSRVKLKVLPAHAIPVGGVDPRLTFCIEVTNLSAFAVTVHDVGVFYCGTDRRGSFVHPVLMDGGAWPRRLEPRSSVTVYGQRPESFPNQRIRCAYARTECGVTKTGSSPALEQIASDGLSP
jgi:hypothetical protein